MHNAAIFCGGVVLGFSLGVWAGVSGKVKESLRSLHDKADAILRAVKSS
jgi:hypothetical protein